MPSIRITCPGCAATYAVPEAQARPDRLVRCAGCTMEWLPFELPPPAPDAEAPPVDVTPPEPSRSIAASLQLHAAATDEVVEAPAGQAGPELVDPEEPDWSDAELPQFDLPAPITHATGPAAPSPPPVPPSRETRWRAAWAASVLLLAMAGAGSVHWREPIMLRWPPSTRLYAAFGNAHMPRAATAEMVAPRAASAISSKPSKISPVGVSE
ncbi:MJ0042-type zinc finger domain-containing protein [Lichenicoccus roseus]|uniref:Zinc finger/thioredoxin putative domain-containing protein n=1 Tax=Lichenicoccus roseus TaxID=2683649 RepID=A0A5R9J7B4_9PROT|nr:MJ0042-type zinc finger domain-containing protein [Lichenicoccus roseus]TLU73462.1 hypothetical protein FE263_08730 [Lichenicoccus roseus]